MKNDNELRWYQRIVLELLWCLCKLIGWLPRFVRFQLLRPFLGFIFWAVGYRRKVIMRNLRNAFKDKSDREIRSIVRRNYLFLAEIAICTISLASVTPKKDSDLIQWPNYDEHQRSVAGRDWIAMASHYGCWEYFLMWTWTDQECRMMGVYHPMRSVVFEHLYRRFRNFSSRIMQVPMAKTIRQYISSRNDDSNIAMGLISDQSPLLRADTEWIEFLGQPTAFVDGGDKIARKFHIPAYFVYVDYVEVGRYAVRFEQIYDGVEEIEDGIITRRYAERLEKMIRQRPELWLWSHNRWRHTPEKQAKKFGSTTYRKR